MAKIGTNGIVNLKVAAAKLQKSLSLSSKKRRSYEHFEDASGSINVPNDVKEGQFVVIAVDDDDLKRFVVPICVLTKTWFLKLLEQAAEEYGFEREGAITVPCRPGELDKVLREQYWVGKKENNFTRVRLGPL